MTKVADKLNLYMCEYGCHNVTVDVDKGVTPFMIGCNFTGRLDRPLSKDPKKTKNGKCTGTAKSSFYPKELPVGMPMPIPTHEWHRPTLSEYMELGSDAEKEHVDNGGLLLRTRTDKTPVKHSDDSDYEIPKYKNFEPPKTVNSIRNKTV